MSRRFARLRSSPFSAKAANGEVDRPQDETEGYRRRRKNPSVSPNRDCHLPICDSRRKWEGSRFKIKCQGACKPGSVARSVSFRTTPALAAIPLGRALPHGSSNQPGRSMRNTSADPCEPARRPYSVLLRVGFAVRRLLPAPRCALTAPFHPYLINQAVCSLWHFPLAKDRNPSPGGRYPPPSFRGARTFLGTLR